MRNKLILTAILGSLSFSAFAAEATDQLTKDEWLGKLKDVVPGMICQNFTQNEAVNKQLVAANIDYNKCISLIPNSFQKCQDKYYSELPSMITKESAPKWGKAIGECIGSDFAMTHLIKPETSSATPTSPSSADSSSTTDTVKSDPATPPKPPANNGDSSTLSKDEWLQKLTSIAPELICKGFFKEESLNQRLTKLKIDYNKCLTLLPPSVGKCQKQYYSDIPMTIDQGIASKWGHTIGECIGKDFAIKYLLADEPNS